MTTKKLLLDDYIKRCNIIHDNYYTYNKVEYKNSKSKIIVTCPKHGDFLIRADAHLNDRGCKICGNNMITENEFIEQANITHNYRYDYTNINYINKKIKILIKCEKHGFFEQKPIKHLSGQGCPFCNKSELFGSKKATKEQFIIESNKKHNNRYDYSLVTELNTIKDKVKINCNKHGIFEQNAHIHMNGNGCPNCGFNTSLAGDGFIKSFNNDNIIKEKIIFIGNKRFKVDGYDETTKTIYEYFGTFWHGHPDRKDLVGIHPFYKLPYTEIYQKTLNRINFFEENGYKVIYKWGK